MFVFELHGSNKVFLFVCPFLRQAVPAQISSSKNENSLIVDNSVLLV